MPLELKVRWDSSEVKDYLSRLPDTSFDAAKKVFAKSVLAADKEVKLNATNKLNVRTGALRRSIRNEVSGISLSTLRASIFSGASGTAKPLIYAPVHETGKVIRAKKAFSRVPGGPYLSIPIADNLTKDAGVMRMTPRMVFTAGGKLFKSKKGNWVITLEDKLMFVLVKEVTIKARLGMVAAGERQIPIVLSGLAALIGE